MPCAPEDRIFPPVASRPAQNVIAAALLSLDMCAIEPRDELQLAALVAPQERHQGNDDAKAHG